MQVAEIMTISAHTINLKLSRRHNSVLLLSSGCGTESALLGAGRGATFVRCLACVMPSSSTRLLCPWR